MDIHLVVVILYSLSEYRRLRYDIILDSGISEF